MLKGHYPLMTDFFVDEKGAKVPLMLQHPNILSDPDESPINTSLCGLQCPEQ